jgi:DNA-binding transcriptional regulator YiaG
MPNVAQVLKLEIKRIAAKEVRVSGLAPKMKALTRRIHALEKRLKALEARPAPALVQYPPAVVAAGAGVFRPTPAAIKRLRARLNLTQIQLARRLGLSHSSVAKWEVGRMSPGPKAAALLQALDVPSAAVAQQPSEQATASPRKGRRFKPTPAVIKRVRARIAVTQAELAVLLGVSHSAVAKWEVGSISPRFQTAAALQALEGIGRREARRRLAAKRQAPSRQEGRRA